MKRGEPGWFGIWLVLHSTGLEEEFGRKKATPQHHAVTIYVPAYQ